MKIITWNPQQTQQIRNQRYRGYGSPSFLNCAATQWAKAFITPPIIHFQRVWEQKFERNETPDENL